MKLVLLILILIPPYSFANMDNDQPEYIKNSPCKILLQKINEAESELSLLIDEVHRGSLKQESCDHSKTNSDLKKLEEHISELNKELEKNCVR